MTNELPLEESRAQRINRYARMSTPFCESCGFTLRTCVCPLPEIPQAIDAETAARVINQADALCAKLFGASPTRRGTSR